jgi:SAM-dependent methyltransferase
MINQLKIENKISDPWKGQGLAILDYFNGNHDAVFTTHCSDGDSDEVKASDFFRTFVEFPLVEQIAIQTSRKHTLDIGAGAGCHALELQKRGLKVTAIDVSPESVDVMQKRGVKDARLLDYKNLKGEQFDTILMMMNGIGVVGDLGGLIRFLDNIQPLLKRKGQIIFDSLDLAEDDTKPDQTPFEEWLRNGGTPPPYIGKLEYRMEYQGELYPSFNWLFIDPHLLTTIAHYTGWYSEILLSQDDGHFLARLIKS